MNAAPVPAPEPDSVAVTSPAPGPDSSRAHRSMATWLTGLVASGVVSLVGFFATPWLVRWLGDGGWGAWQVIGEWLGYLGLTQLAMGPGALVVLLLRAHAEGSPRDLTAAAKRGVQLYFWAALVLAPVALGLAWLAPAGMHAGPRLAPALRWAVGIAAISSLLLGPLTVFRGVLETVQHGYRVRGALLLQSLLITAGSLLLCWLGWGVTGMAIAAAAGMLVGALLWWQSARRWLPQWRNTPAATWGWRELWTLNWPLIASHVGNQINQLTDNTIVAWRLGPAAVAGFALTQALPQLGSQHWTDIGGISWAPLGELRQRDPHGFQIRLIELAAVVLGAGLALLATLAVCNQAFVTLWVGAQHYDGAALTWVSAADAVVFGHICFYAWLTDTQGDARRRLAVSSIGSVLNLSLSLALIRPLGVTGVALGTLIAYLCTDAWYLPRLVSRLYGVPGGALARNLAAAGAKGGAWAAVMLWLALRLPAPANWWRLAGEALVLGTAALAYCWLVVLRSEDRRLWHGRLSALRRKG